MTCRTVGQFSCRSQLIHSRKFLPQLFLICGSFPVHIENLILRPQIRLRIPVALQAEIHVQRRGLEHQRHLIDWPVAGRAANSLIYMNAVIEINVVGQPVHFHPVNRFIRAVALANYFQVPHIIEQHRMAIHARPRRWNPRIRRVFHARVAIPAIDSVIPHVVFVAELDRLITRHILIGNVG